MAHINYHESINHGTLDLPYAIYHTKIPDFFKAYPLHWHDEFEIIYVQDGSSCFVVDNLKITAFKGDLIVIPPQVPHSIEQHLDNKADFFNFLFRADAIVDKSTCSYLYEKYIEPFESGFKQITYYQKQYSPLNKEATPLLQELIDKRHDVYSKDELLVISTIFKLLQLINKYAKNTHTPSNIDKSLGFIKDAVFKVQQMYPQDLSIEYMAQSLNVSKSHFMKTFKKTMGVSFTQYLIDYRLKIAARQLKEGKLKIFEISNNCGFNNGSYFIRSFKEKYKTSPKNYQKMFKIEKRK